MDEFVYNAAGQRATIWNGNTKTVIQGQYYWGGKRVAYYNGGSLHFQHQDWMGTEHIRSSYNGGGDGQFTSLPFGDDLTTTGGTDTDAYHFAQIDHDYETNTEHAQFRQYSSAQGRFLSPDPYGGSYDPSNPQSFNRYAYVMNNPLSAIDPSGKNLVMQCDNNGNCITYDDGQGTVDNGYGPGDCNGPDVSVCVTGALSSGPSTSTPTVGPSIGPDSGGKGSAPSDQRSGYESLFCLGDALQSTGVSLTLDAIGLIPEGGAVSAAFSLWHGAAGVSQGTKLLQGAQMGAGLIGTASAANAAQNGGGNLDQAQAVSGGLSIFAALGKAAPVYGQLLSLGSLGIDAAKTYQAQSACVDSGKYD